MGYSVDVLQQQFRLPENDRDIERTASFFAEGRNSFVDLSEVYSKLLTYEEKRREEKTMEKTFK